MCFWADELSSLVVVLNISAKVIALVALGSCAIKPCRLRLCVNEVCFDHSWENIVLEDETNNFEGKKAIKVS